MNAFHAAVSSCAAVALAASTAIAQPELNCSFDAASPEVALFGEAEQADIGTVFLPPSDLGWLRQSRAMLGLPIGAEIDALCHGYSLIFSTSAGGFDAALCFTVDRDTHGLAGGGVRAERTRDDAVAADVYRIDWPGAGAIPHVVTAIHTPWLTQLPGGAGTDIDAIRFEVGFPVYYSVDSATAAMLSAMQGRFIAAGDILVTRSPGDTPDIYLTHAALGLGPDDDMDALVFGRGGVLFSVSKTSPLALAHPAVGGAGLFLGGGAIWATAAEMELETTDELNGLEAEIFEPDFRQTPYIAGQRTTYRVDYQVPGSIVYVVASLSPAFDPPICVPGLFCINVLPEFVLGSAIVGADGSATVFIDLPASAPSGLLLSTQAIVIEPGGSASATSEYVEAFVF